MRLEAHGAGRHQRRKRRRHRRRHELETPGMRLVLEHEAWGIDPAERVVQVRTPRDDHTLGYDRLIIATGAVPVRPPLPELPGVHVLHAMDDPLELQGELNESAADAAVIVGAGDIGLEMADALLQRGMRVTIVEQAPEVLPTVSRGPDHRSSRVRGGRAHRPRRPHCTPGRPSTTTNDLDLSYSPPLGSPWDPLQQAAQQ